MQTYAGIDRYKLMVTMHRIFMEGLKLMSNVKSIYLLNHTRINMKLMLLLHQKSIVKRDFKEKQCLRHKLG